MRRRVMLLSLIVLLIHVSSILHASVSGQASPNPLVMKAYENLPLSFVENHGQMNDQIRYAITGQRASAFFRNDGVMFDLWGKAECVVSGQSLVGSGETEVPVASGDSRFAARGLRVASGKFDLSHSSHQSDSSCPVKHSALKLTFAGANPDCMVQGVGELPGKVNYLIGRDQSRWHTGIPSFKGVIYRNVWPGIDVAYHGERQQLKYDIIAAPGADLESIRLRYEGAQKIWLGKAGDLHVKTAVTTFVERVPGIYQENDGVKVALNGGYVLNGNTVSFQVQGRDPSLPLTIDPANSLLYSTYLGGAGGATNTSIVLDSSGCAYVTGDASTGFPTTTGAYDTTFHRFADAYVAKFNATGSALVYSTYLGGKANDQSNSIAVDSSDCAYVAGWTHSTDFPTTSGAFVTTFSGSQEAFVTKLNAAGTALVYSTFLGGSSSASAASIALDSSDHAYIVGQTESSDFPTTTGAFQTALSAYTDAFAMELNAAGSALIYSTYLGGSLLDEAYSVRVDSSGCAYVTGWTESSDFPTTTGAFQTTLQSSYGNAFVTKLNASGSALLYSTYLGGMSVDAGKSIAIDSSGCAYVAGYTGSSNFPTTTGAFDTTFIGGEDAFVTKMNAAGTALIYSTLLGSSNYNWCNSITVDSSKCALVTGGTQSPTFPTTRGAFDQAFNMSSSQMGFVTKLNAAGAKLVYSTLLGGSTKEEAISITVDSLGSAYVAGNAISTDFPTTTGAFDTTFNGLAGVGEAFVAELNMNTPLAGLASGGGVFYTSDMSTWQSVPGALSTLLMCDLAGTGYSLAGLASNDSIWYTTDFANWNNIPGNLKSLTVGDFSGSGKDGIAGLASDGSVWCTTDLQNWTNVPGFLHALTAANFAGSGAWGLAGTASDNSIWFSEDLLTWNNIPGQLVSLVPGCFNGSGKDGVAGLASDHSIWYTNDLVNWNKIPGQLSSLVVGDFNGSGSDGIAGLASDNSIWYTTDLATWNNIPGYLTSLTVGDFNADGKDDLAGLATGGSIWCTTDLQTWQSIPGQLSSLVSYRK